MLRLSAFSGLAAKLRFPIGKLQPLLAKLGLDKLSLSAPCADGATAPPPPWPLRAKAVAVRGGLISGCALALIVFAGLLTGDRQAGLPLVLLDFGDKSQAHKPSGETAAHPDARGPVITPEIADYYEKGPYGPLPKIAADGTLPAQEFGHPPEVTSGRAMVSVVVSGLGLDEIATRDAVGRLPAAIGLAFSPYANNLAGQVDLARRAGHEVFIQIPVEPFDFPSSDPGPLVLLVDAKTDTNIDRLRHAMGLSVGYVGLLTSGRARFATTKAAITPVAKEAKARGLLLLDDGSAPISKTESVAEEIGTLTSEVDRRLDARPSGDGTALALLNLERLAIDKGRAIGATDLYPIAVDRLARWSDTLARKGLVLQPVSVQMLPVATKDNGSSQKASKNEHDGAKRH